MATPKAPSVPSKVHQAYRNFHHQKSLKKWDEFYPPKMDLSPTIQTKMGLFWHIHFDNSPTIQTKMEN